MPLAWFCMVDPVHGAFFQHGLTELEKIAPEMQPENRFACPKCWAEHKPGHVRAATETEASRLLAMQGG